MLSLPQWELLLLRLLQREAKRERDKAHGSPVVHTKVLGSKPGSCGSLHRVRQGWRLSLQSACLHIGWQGAGWPEVPAELVYTLVLALVDSSLLSICKAPVGLQRRRSGLEPERGLVL